MTPKMSFSDILASTLHDTKNSLGILFNNLENIIAGCREKNCAQYQDFYLLQYEIKRLNHSLIRLLSLYKAEKSQLTMNVDFHSARELLEDVAVQHEILLASRGIQVDIDCDGGLFHAMDRNLIMGVIDNIINNAFRYTKSAVRLSAAVDGGYFVIRVEDDGDGYPPSMLFNEQQDPNFSGNVDFSTGSTGLGLYFSTMVAQMHVNRDQSGFISIYNGGTLRGGVFSIYLP